MALKFELDVEGIVAAFKKAEKRLGENIPVALSLGANLVVNQAKEVHDYQDRDGELTKSIMADEVEGTFEQGNLQVVVSAGAPYALFVEEGTRPHKIRPRFKKALRWPIEGGFAFAQEVNHPGTDATNFLANAGEAKLPAMAEVIEDAATLSFLQAGFEVE